MSTRYLRKTYEGAPVHLWTEILAGHKGMVECTADGTIIGEAIPEDEVGDNLKQSPFENVPIVKLAPVEEPPINFEPEPVVEDLPPADEPQPPVSVAPGIPEVAAKIEERADRVLEIQAMLTPLSGPDIRRKVREEFNGHKLPIGISKLAMVEHFVELDRARAAQGGG